MITRTRTHEHPSTPDHTVRLWAFEGSEAALSADAAADTFALGDSRWLDQALESIDDGYSIFPDLFPA